MYIKHDIENQLFKNKTRKKRYVRKIFFAKKWRNVVKSGRYHYICGGE